jgi:hypothetical protein
LSSLDIAHENIDIYKSSLLPVDTLLLN